MIYLGSIVGEKKVVLQKRAGLRRISVVRFYDGGCIFMLIVGFASRARSITKLCWIDPAVLEQYQIPLVFLLTHNLFVT